MERETHIKSVDFAILGLSEFSDCTDIVDTGRRSRPVAAGSWREHFFGTVVSVLK
jgi:hypothetical protein